MIRAVVWKEFREQWLIALTLVVLGGGLLVGTATLGDPPTPGANATDVIKSLGLGRLATLMLVVTAGMVCGGALFAAEREAGTLTFLEVLPAARWSLWRAKLLAGVALALAQACVLLAFAATLGLADRPFATRLLMYGLLAFAWGTLGSTLARTTLGSVGIAIPAATLATFGFLFPICLVFAPPGSNYPRPLGWLVFEALMLVAPLAASGWWFTAPDRARATGHDRAASGPRVLVWLALRQLRITGLVLSAFALAFGFSLLAPDTRVVFVWPALALAAGTLAGVTAFGDEQSNRTAAFWAEGRLPVGRAWAAKIGVHLVLVGWLLLLLALPSAVRSQFEVQPRFSYGRSTFAVIFRDRLFDELGPQSWKYLLVPAAYGFAAGHVCGMLFRKLIVACGVAVMVGGCLAALWGPSLLGGGLRHWQVWLPAAVLLLTGRFVVRSWACGRVTHRGPLLHLAGGTGAAILVLAMGLGYRVLEVPDLPDAEDDIAYVDALTKYDENLSGREFRSATERYARTATSVAQEPERQADARQRPRLDERLDLVLRQGWPLARSFRFPLWKGFQTELVFQHRWPVSDPDLASWLDGVYSDAHVAPDESHWYAIATTAGTKPVGIFELPQLFNNVAMTAVSLENARRMAIVLLVRSLQQQAAGDSGAFAPAFRTVLALAQNLRNGSGVMALLAGIEVERYAFLAADRWLERDTGSADPLRALVREIERRDVPGDLDTLPHYLADRYRLREQMRAPGSWLSANLTPVGGTEEQIAGEVDLVAFAWTVSWERERTRRLLGLGFEQGASGPVAERAGVVSGRPGSGMLLTRNRSVGDLVENDRNLRAQRRAMILKLAVRAYQTDRRSAPVALADLVAGGYLGVVPADPYHEEQRPFGYRVSAGENLRGTRLSGPGRLGDEVQFPIKRGQILVWSVGTDRKDQGGRVAPGGSRAEDLVFLVPMFPALPR